jgi:hypothetical protein
MCFVKYLSMQKASSFVILALFFSGFSSHAALTLKQQVKICDSFYAQDKPPAQESGQYSDMQDFLVSRFVECANTYEKANQQEKIEYAQVQHQRLYDTYTNFVSSFDTADCESDDLSDFGFRDFKDLQGEMSEFGLQKVKNINNFQNTRADTSNLGAFVGALRKQGERGQCNVNYVEYPDGSRALTTPSHCLFKDGELKTELENITLEFGLELGSSNNEVLRIKDIRCATLTPYKDANLSFANDACLIIPDKYPKKVEPAFREFLTVDEINELMRRTSIYSFGFHGNGYLKGKTVQADNSEIRYDAFKTRIRQRCNIMPNRDETSGLANFVIHDCDTLPNSSGLAITYFNEKTKKFHMIGMHTDALHSDSNMASNVLPTRFSKSLNLEIVSK